MPKTAKAHILTQSHIEFLYEKYLGKKQHADGTYVSAQLDKASTDDLFAWVKENKIPNPYDPNEYHVTIVYSRKGIPEVENYKFDLPIKCEISSFEIFTTQSNTQCLVAKLSSECLTSIHNDIRKKYGATHDFPSYKPHVTLSYDYGSDEVPKDLPKIPLTFDKVAVKPLNLDYKPKVAE